MSSDAKTQEFSEGDKVKLLKNIVGSVEKDFVIGSPDNRSNRKRITLPQGTEVVIRKTEGRSLPRTSTGGQGVLAIEKDYSCQKAMNASYRLVKETSDYSEDHRIPHTSLSSTPGGNPEATIFLPEQYAHVIREFSFNSGGRKKTVQVNEVIRIGSEPFTKTGRVLSSSTVYPQLAHYEFYMTDSRERKPVWWKSDQFHPASTFEKI